MQRTSKRSSSKTAPNSPVVPPFPALQLCVTHRGKPATQQRREDDVHEREPESRVRQQRKPTRQMREAELAREGFHERNEEVVHPLHDPRAHRSSQRTKGRLVDWPARVLRCPDPMPVPAGAVAGVQSARVCNVRPRYQSCVSGRHSTAVMFL